MKNCILLFWLWVISVASTSVHAQTTDLASRYSDTLSFKDLFPRIESNDSWRSVESRLGYRLDWPTGLEGGFDDLMAEKSRKLAKSKSTFFGVYDGRYFVLVAEVNGPTKWGKEQLNALAELTKDYANEVVKELAGKDARAIHDDRFEDLISTENCERVYPDAAEDVLEKNMDRKKTFLLKVLRLGKSDRGDVWVLVRFFDIPGCPYRECEGFEEWASDVSSCEASCYGCTDPVACNFDQTASVDDESCEFDCYGCLDDSADNYCTSCTKSDGSCIYSGCTDPLHPDYSAIATTDDGSCHYPGHAILTTGRASVAVSATNECVYAIDANGKILSFGENNAMVDLPSLVRESEFSSIHTWGNRALGLTIDSLAFVWGDSYPRGKVDPMAVGKVLQLGFGFYTSVWTLNSEKQFQYWRNPLLAERDWGFEEVPAFVFENNIYREAKGFHEIQKCGENIYASDGRGRLYVCSDFGYVDWDADEYTKPYISNDSLIFTLHVEDFESFVGDCYLNFSGRIVALKPIHSSLKEAMNIAGRNIKEFRTTSEPGDDNPSCLALNDENRLLVYTKFERSSGLKPLKVWIDDVVDFHGGLETFVVVKGNGELGFGSFIKHLARRKSDNPFFYDDENRLLGWKDFADLTDEEGIYEEIGDREVYVPSRFNTKTGEVADVNRFELCPDKDIREQDVYTIDEMVEYFICDCLNEGIGIRPQTIQATFESLTDPTIALAFGRDMDRDVIVKVDPTNWKRASLPKKWYILYHELGHDIFNLEHGQGGKMMFNFANKEYSWAEFLADRAKMFSYVVRNQ